MANHIGTHNSEDNKQTSSPRNNGARWEAWIRVFLSFVCGTLSAAFLLGGKSRDISDLQIWRTHVDTKLERMDKDGTNRSHWTDDSQSLQITANQTRLTDVEKRIEQQGEKINVMQGKLDRIEREQEIAKDRIPK